MHGVCRVCIEPHNGEMRPCKTCKHQVHGTCAAHASFRVEVVCKTCTTRPQVASPPTKKKQRCDFKTQWQLAPIAAVCEQVVWCIACSEYPQPGCNNLG